MTKAIGPSERCLALLFMWARPALKSSKLKHVVKWMHDIVKLKRKNPVYTKIIVLSDKAILTYFFLFKI